MKLFIIAVIYIIFQIYMVDGSVYEYRLLNDVFQNYSSKARPSISNLDTTTIYISVALTQIISVDDRNQVITVYIWVTLFWFDPKLTWDPLNYNNLTDIVVPASDVWKPHLTMDQPAEKIMFDIDYDIAQISYQGFVSWLPNGAYNLYCEIHAEYFPFDEQNCSLIFLSQFYSIYQLNLSIYSNLIMSHYLNNTEWDFVNTTSFKTDEPLQSVIFSFVIRRKPLYLVISYMLPCIVTLAVSFLAFFVPAESSEKMSISITCLLSLLVLLLVVSGALPPTNNSFPLIGTFYSAAIAINALISLTSVIILNIHHYGEIGKPVPMRFQRLFFSLLGKIIMFPKNGHIDMIRSKSKQSEETEKSVIIREKSNEDLVEIKKKNPCTNFSRSLKEIFSNSSNKIGSTDFTKDHEIDKEQAQLQWTLLADIIERTLFYIFFYCDHLHFAWYN